MRKFSSYNDFRNAGTGGIDLVSLCGEFAFGNLPVKAYIETLILVAKSDMQAVDEMHRTTRAFLRAIELGLTYSDSIGFFNVAQGLLEKDDYFNRHDDTKYHGYVEDDVLMEAAKRI